jgi:hydroxymethylglutaryl-CoA lyase
MSSPKIIECPRDAMQGIKPFIPTSKKVSYLQSLLDVGFDTLDFGSFVSPRAVPQMQDSEAVLNNLDLSNTKTRLLAIVANLRGAQKACNLKKIDFLGYPFSISENFQMRNTHKTISESLTVLERILELTCLYDKTLVVYLSMGFGNPYGDPWNVDIVGSWTETLAKMGVKIVSLSDTVGTADPDDVSYLFSKLITQFPEIEFGAHFHTQPKQWYEKVDAAFNAGCLRFDGAVQGYGGCPMAKDELTGNMPTEKLINFFSEKKIPHKLNLAHFESAHNRATQLFTSYK